MARTKVAHTPSSIVLRPLSGGNQPISLRRELVVGRCKSCDLVINQNFMSRKHARLIPCEGGLIVEDLGSVNGTYVNGRLARSPMRANHKDTIRFDTLAFEVRVVVDFDDTANINDTQHRMTTIRDRKVKSSAILNNNVPAVRKIVRMDSPRSPQTRSAIASNNQQNRNSARNQLIPGNYRPTPQQKQRLAYKKRQADLRQSPGVNANNRRNGANGRAYSNTNPNLNRGYNNNQRNTGRTSSGENTVRTKRRPVNNTPQNNGQSINGRLLPASNRPVRQTPNSVNPARKALSAPKPAARKALASPNNAKVAPKQKSADTTIKKNKDQTTLRSGKKPKLDPSRNETLSIAIGKELLDSTENWALGHAKRTSLEARSAKTPIIKRNFDIDIDISGVALIGLSGSSKGKIFRFASDANLTKWEIGRDRSCNVIISHSSVSRNHAQIVHDGRRWKLVDLMSANGTHINGSKSVIGYLESGDTVTFGSQDFLFKVGDDEYEWDGDRQEKVARVVRSVVSAASFGLIKKN